MDLPYHADKCACGKNGRFWLDKRVANLKLCLDCMQYWLTMKTQDFIPTLATKRD